MIRLIKRYNNRKLYDTKDSCYLTLQDVANHVKNGEIIAVIDNSTKKDLTYTTLLNCIFNNEASNPPSAIKLKLLIDTLQTENGTFSDQLSKKDDVNTNEA